MKIGDCLDVKYGKDYKHLNEGKYPVLGTGGVMEYVDDFLYSGESILIGRKGTIDKPKYINDSFWTVDTLFYTEIKKQFPKFLFYCISNINWLKYNEASGVPSLSANNIKSVKINVPSLNEQKKIANFITSIDYKIELLEKKYESYVNFKKYLMQQIFAQKLRFELEGDWETKFINEIFDITRGDVIAKTLIKETPDDEYCYPVFSSQTTNKGIMGYYNDFDFNGEYITWTTDGANAGKTVYRNGKFKCSNVCGVLKAKTEYEGFANQFIAEYLDSITHRYVSYVGNPKLMNNVMAKIKIKYPPLDEQKKISELFNKVDFSIDLIENQITSTNEFKKGLLQQMFV